MNEKDLEKVREEISIKLWRIEHCESVRRGEIKDGDKYPEELADRYLQQAEQILTIPITIERECSQCKGKKVILWHDRQSGAEFRGADIESPCPICNGTGKVVRTFTIKEAIEEKLEC